MRQTIRTTILLVLTFYNLNGLAQQNDKRHQIDVMISDGILIDVIHSFSDIFSYIDTDNYVKTSQRTHKSSGTLSFRYQYKLNKTLSIGTDIGYMKATSKQKVKNIQTDENLTLRRNTHVYNVYAILEVRYFTNSSDSFKIYGNIAGGLTHFNSGKLKNTDNIENVFALQINPIGMHYGKKLAIFGELGFGFKGVFTIGASYRI